MWHAQGRKRCVVVLLKPPQFFCFCIGELPCASKEVNVVDWSSLVSSDISQTAILMQTDPSLPRSTSKPARVAECRLGIHFSQA